MIVHIDVFVWTAGSFTCDDIQELGAEATVLGVQDIAGLSDADFDDCAAVLGDITDWSLAQKEALATKAKEVELCGVFQSCQKDTFCFLELMLKY